MHQPAGSKPGCSGGFQQKRIVLNGPAKDWPHAANLRPLKAIYADSLEELVELVSAPKAAAAPSVFALRLPCFQFAFRHRHRRLRRVSPPSVRRLAPAPIGIEIGMHHHLASAFIGQKLWNDAFDSLISWAETIGGQVGRPVSTPRPGGWLLPGGLRSAGPRCHGGSRPFALAEASSAWCWSRGAPLTQETMAIADPRAGGAAADEINHPDGHRGGHLRGRTAPVRHAAPSRDSCPAERLMAGAGARLHAGCSGASAWKTTFLSEGIGVADDIAIGDRLLFLDAGAYDRSMAYEFGKGGLEETGGMDRNWSSELLGA